MYSFLTHYRLVLGLLCCLLPASLRAEEPATRYRIIGLFGLERQQDLRDQLANLPEIQLVRINFDAAEVELRYDLAKLFPDVNPKKPHSAEEIRQRLDERLASVSRGAFRLTPRSTLPADKLTRVEIDIGILDCKACRLGAYRAVMGIDGVQRALVTATPSRVTAWIDAAKTNRAALETALKRVGAALSAK